MEMNGEDDSKKKSAMVWSEYMDLVMLKEVAAEGVLQHKQKSRERGSCWATVATHLNPQPNFDVTARSVRDHFNTITRKHKVKMAKEERLTGEGGESLTERENLMEELILISEETDKRADNENEVRKEIYEKEKAQALQMRQRAMERCGESKKREAEDRGETEKERKRRRSGGDIHTWLAEHTMAQRQMKEQEINEKKVERQAQREQFAMMQQQMIMMMQQQQKQTEMLAELFKNQKK